MQQLIPTFTKVLWKRKETEDTFSLLLDVKMQHEPGQYVHLGILGIGEVPISIASYNENSLLVTIREVGTVTKALSKIKKGHQITIRGPYGKGYPMDSLKGNNLIIIGGGCGIAPLKGVIDYVMHHRENYQDIQLFLGYRGPSDILYEEFLNQWKQQFKLFVTFDKNPGPTCYEGKVGFITEAVKEQVKDNNQKAVFMCGPPMMIKKTVEILKQKRFHDDQIFISMERLMHCSIGLCCHCMIHDKFTCIDGPVFRYDEIKGFKND